MYTKLRTTTCFVLGAFILTSPILATKVYATDNYELIATEAESWAENSTGGTCKVFVQDVLSNVGITLGTGYREEYLETGYWITPDQAGRGDLIQLAEPDDPENSDDANLHSAIIEEVTGGGTFDVADSNWDLDNLVHHRSYNPVSDAENRPDSKAVFFRVNNSGLGREKAFLPVLSGSASSTGLSATSTDAIIGSVAFSPVTFLPYVSWISTDTDFSGTYKFDGSAWTPLGGTGNKGGYIAFDSTGVLYKIWYGVGTGGDNEIFVHKYDVVNDEWDEVGTGSGSGGGISNNSGHSYTPRIAFNDSDVPFATWNDNSSPNSNYEIYVKKYDSGTGTWVEVGTGSASGYGISNNSSESYLSKIVFSGNNPVVFWGNAYASGNVIYTKYFNGSSWADLSTNSSTGLGVTGNSNTGIQNGSVVSAPDGTIYLSWTYKVSQGIDENMHIKKWTSGSGWADVGSGSASGNGLISNSGTTWEASLALDENNLPYISWAETNSGNFEVYMKKFNGSSWVEVVSGSGSGAGISGTGGASKLPWVAIGRDGNPIVAWMEYVSGISQIFVKSFR